MAGSSEGLVPTAKQAPARGGFDGGTKASVYLPMLGDLTLAAYRSFLPNGEAYAQLRDMVSMYVGVEHEWELVPVLKREEVPYSWAGNPGLLLGWSSWLGVRYEDVDAVDLVLPMTPRLQAARPMPAHAGG